MSYRRLAQPDPTPHNSSTSARSPATFRNFPENVVPSGTVASRVRHLQSLANAASAIPASPSTKHREDRPRENSRIGFGRRISNRFAQPASRNTKLDELSQVESSHSFLGLNTPRINHVEEHAISNRRAGYDRTARLYGQIKPGGLTEVAQHDAAAPWSIIPTGTSHRAMGREHSERDFGVLQECDPSGNQNHVAGQTPIFCGPSNEDTCKLHNARRGVQSRQDDAINSDASAATSSTLRRQSVRDLFERYGIERPTGLVSVSAEATSRGVEHTPRPPTQLRYCHVCSWVNDSLQQSCWSCGHKLCTECIALSHFSNAGSQPNLENVERSGKEGRSSSSREPKELSQMRISILPANFPSSPFKKSFSGKAARYSPSHHLVPPEKPRLLSVLSVSGTTTRVKDSPFLVADLFAARQSRRLLPFVESTTQKNKPNQHHRQSSQSMLSSPDSRDCDSSACRATHPGHTPYRHAITCTSKNRRNRRETGYEGVTHMSFGEDTTNGRRPTISLSKFNSGVSTLAEIFPSSEIPERIECHGYPRTGHARHVSPVTSGVVGECQHCIDDCQCSACQNTLHRVRCCVHADHNPLAHHHHNFRRVAATPYPTELLPSPPSPDVVLTLDESTFIQNNQMCLTPTSTKTTSPDRIALKKTLGKCKEGMSVSMKSQSDLTPKFTEGMSLQVPALFKGSSSTISTHTPERTWVTIYSEDNNEVDLRNPDRQTSIPDSRRKIKLAPRPFLRRRGAMRGFASQQLGEKKLVRLQSPRLEEYREESRSVETLFDRRIDDVLFPGNAGYCNGANEKVGNGELLPLERAVKASSASSGERVIVVNGCGLGGGVEDINAEALKDIIATQKSAEVPAKKKDDVYVTGTVLLDQSASSGPAKVLEIGKLTRETDMQGQGLGILGITLVIHFQGRDDLVLKASMS